MGGLFVGGAVLSAPALAAFRGSLYVFGGYDGRVEHRSIEKFDPETGQWCSASAKRTAMPVEACEVSAVVLGPHIYIIVCSQGPMWWEGSEGGGWGETATGAAF